MYPGEVTGAASGAEADEAGVDVEVPRGVGDECEVLVFSAMEEEYAAVAADEAGVVAARSKTVAVGLAICSIMVKRVSVHHRNSRDKREG